MTGLSLAAHLRDVPLFAGISDAHLERLAGHATQQRLDAGTWLFREGDPGDCLFVVAAGSLDVLVEEGGPAVIRTLRRGDQVGELAILTDTPRSASVRAHRDTLLIRLERADVEALLLGEPSFGVSLTRSLGRLLHETRAPATGQPTSPATIALVPLQADAPLTEVAEALTAALTRLGTVARLSGDDEISLETLDRLEQAHDHVLLVAHEPAVDDPWTAFCIRQSDRLLALAARPYDRRPGGIDPRLHGCDLVVRAAPGTEPDLAGWMGALEPRTAHILREGSPAGVGRMARRLAGRSLGVVLSGGGARGFAHVGVVEELLRAGYAVDRIGGASMGAMVGSLFAEGRPAGEVVEVLEAHYVRTSPLAGRTLPLVSLSKGERALAAQERLHAGRRIEGLDIDFYCVSADLAAQHLVVHRHGLVATAVSASQALPAFVPPLKDGERLLVDGAVLNNLPVVPMASMGEGPVVAVDVSGRLPAPRAARSHIPKSIRRWIIGPAVDWAPSITETLLRSILLGNVATDAAARALADLVIAPSLEGVATMRFTDIATPRAAGRAAARAAIDAGALDALSVPRGE